MILAVKYCGGCNVSYDRAAMVERLRREFPAATIVSAENLDGVEPDLVLVVCGCASVCASHSHLDAKHGKIFFASAHDFAAARQKIAHIAAGDPDSGDCP